MAGSRLAVIVSKMLTVHGGTHRAYESVVRGESDIGLVARMPSSDELKLATERGVALDVEPFALDAFVFIKHYKNPVKSLTVEQIQGAKNQSQDTGEFKGKVVGAWRITKHFDIKRAYNPTTGEESNVLEENAMDCKWYDCTYLRINWSKNFAKEETFLGWDFPALIKGAAAFSEQDASDPRYKPIFDMNVTRGMRTAWYGMNIPNNRTGNTILAHLNFHLASTKPLMEPSTDEIVAAGTTIFTEFQRLGRSASQAARKLSNDNPAGRFHIVRRLTSSKLLNPVFNITKSGTR